jgi:peptidoglycan-associated lipoprotein
MIGPRPTANRTAGRIFAIILTALVCLAKPGYRTAIAEESDNDVPIGTFNLSPSVTGATPSGSDRSDRPGHPLADEATEELYDDAVAALGARRDAEAQRLFERLIAEAPDSALAKEARRHLAKLYRTMPKDDVTERGEGRDSARSQVEAPAPSGEESQRSGLGGPPDGARQRGAHVADAIEEQFIAEAGDRVFFSAGSAELGSRARGVLQAQARFIKLRPQLEATIEGHADDAPLSVGEHAKLSEARAEAVRQRLIAEGVESHRLASVYWGRERRVSECPEPECAAQNRRAVTVLFNAPARRSGRPLDPNPDPASVAAREPALLTH